MRKTNITENHSTGHGSLLLAALAKFSGHTINKTEAVTITKAHITTPTSPRTSLFSPMFDATRAVMAKAAASMPTPHGPREDIKAPQKPSAPTSVTSTSLYRRTPAQVDVEAARHHQQMKASADARTALLNEIKAIHSGKGVSQ